MTTASRTHAVVLTEMGCGRGGGVPVGRRCRRVPWTGALPRGAPARVAGPVAAGVPSALSLMAHAAFQATPQSAAAICSNRVPLVRRLVLIMHRRGLSGHAALWLTSSDDRIRSHVALRGPAVSVRNLARVASVCLMSCPDARICAAVAGAAEPYIRMSGRPSVVPMSPMPGCAPGAAADDVDVIPDAMPVGPSGPAQPGVITATVAAITAAGITAMLAMAAKPVRRRTGRPARDGRHSRAAQPCDQREFQQRADHVQGAERLG